MIIYVPETNSAANRLRPVSQLDAQQNQHSVVLLLIIFVSAGPSAVHLLPPAPDRLEPQQDVLYLRAAKHQRIIYALEAVSAVLQPQLVSPTDAPSRQHLCVRHPRIICVQAVNSVARRPPLVLRLDANQKIRVSLPRIIFALEAAFAALQRRLVSLMDARFLDPVVPDKPHARGETFVVHLEQRVVSQDAKHLQLAHPPDILFVQSTPAIVVLPPFRVSRLELVLSVQDLHQFHHHHHRLQQQS